MTNTSFQRRRYSDLEQNDYLMDDSRPLIGSRVGFSRRRRRPLPSELIYRLNANPDQNFKIEIPHEPNYILRKLLVLGVAGGAAKLFKDSQSESAKFGDTVMSVLGDKAIPMARFAVNLGLGYISGGTIQI